MSEMREPRADIRDDTRSDATRENVRSENVRSEDVRREEMPREGQIPSATSEPMQRKPGEPMGSSQMDLWPDMTDFEKRFEKIQSEFIEDPKSAVKNAERLLQEAIDRMAKSMHERMQSMHRDVEGKDGDTETLRQTMRSYRVWIATMGSRRAA